MEKKIIAIDGGGIWGIVPAYILMQIERQIDDHLFNHVDLVAGTSTGGIIAGGIARGLSMDKILAFYQEDGPQIFSKQSFIKQAKSVFGLFGSKYSTEILKENLLERLGDITLDDLYIDYLSTAYNMTDGRPRFFSKSQEGSLKLVDVIAGGAAAPTYFVPNKIGGKEYSDGGLFCANPAMSAFAEAKGLYSGIKAEDIFLLSLGTGSKEQGYSSVYKWFKYKWIRPLIDIMMSADAGVAHYQLVQIYKSAKAPGNYYRINGRIPKGIDKEMDDASPENIKVMMSFAEDLFMKNKRRIKEIAAKLKA
jgi:patatin-like phospholipase/acyl hydrolase